MSAPIITYIRVSTADQGRSGLGLKAQREMIARFAVSEGVEFAGESIEVATGKGSDTLEKRPMLAQALRRAKKIGGYIVVAKLDRLSRNVHFISGPMDKYAPFIVCTAATSICSCCTSMPCSPRRSAP